MTKESLQRGSEIQKLIYSLQDNKRVLKSLTPYVLVPVSELAISSTQIKFNEKENDEFHNFISSVIKRIDDDLAKLEHEFENL